MAKNNHNYLQGFINQFEENGEHQEMSNNDWTVSQFLNWLRINNFEIIRNKKKIQWVFWLTIEKRQWFKKFWKSRSANSMDIQILNYRISIGMPWHKTVIEMAGINYPLEGIDHMLKTNEQNKLGIKKWGRFRYIKN